jgi:hypothetical protein
VFNRKQKTSDNGGKVNVFVRFKDQEGVDIPSYQPGAALIGVVNIEANREININGIDIELRWETQGKGDRDRETVDHDHITGGQLVPGDTLQHPFNFITPQAPWSYQGELIQIVWMLHIKVDVANVLDLFGLMDVQHQEPFVLRP